MKNQLNRLLLLFAINLIAGTIITKAQPNYPTSPENAELIYSDVVNFIEAYQYLNKDADTIAVLNKYYFDRSSAGLKEYIIKHSLTPELLKAAIAKDPDRYAKIPGFLAVAEAFKPEYSMLMKQFGEVLPSAMYPPTYLLVGANRGIAQASKYGQLVTITRVVDSNEKLKKLIVHELAHFQQAITMGIQEYGALYGKADNMLGLCLREGGAEFITYLVLNQITQTKGLEYFRQHELDLKSRFKSDLATQNPGYWLWDSIEDPETPNLLGYVIGFKICEAYYQNSTEKNNALKDILAITQPEGFVEKSQFFKE